MGLRDESPNWQGRSRAAVGSGRKSGAMVSGCSRTTQSASAHQQRSRKASPQKASPSRILSRRVDVSQRA
eukprot:1698761-Pleurochrysis_carterae.AAC.1